MRPAGTTLAALATAGPLTLAAAGQALAAHGTLVLNGYVAVVSQGKEGVLDPGDSLSMR
ncbi:hypothetical protein [Streptomyces achromogenes]|uniref:hypothetical protein n=1 Tax=Streptomyces achromogenes TaxID=67255 RepID=UPI0036B9FD91